MIRISKEQVLILHSHLFSETGGTDGVRDEGLLESAIAAPFQSFGGAEVFKDRGSLYARISCS